jgi:hypothetical protein
LGTSATALPAIAAATPAASAGEFVHVCVDDCSRVAYAEVLADEAGPTIAGFQRRAVAWFRRRGGPRAARADRQWHWLSLARLRGRLSGAPARAPAYAAYTPRTNGKR